MAKRKTEGRRQRSTKGVRGSAQDRKRQNVEAMGMTSDVRERITALRKLVNSSAFAQTINTFGSDVQRQGRRARRYVADAAAVKGVNDTVSAVFATIKNAGKAGITQAEVQERLTLPHSTVWYALVKLRKRNAVTHA